MGTPVLIPRYNFWVGVAEGVVEPGRDDRPLGHEVIEQRRG